MLKAGRRAAEAAERIAEETPVEPPKSASVSLWHKIFGLPTEQNAKLSSSSAEIEPTESIAEARRPADRGWEDEFGPTPERARSEKLDTQEDFKAEPQVDDALAEEKKRRRPRRRRRGGRPDEERGDQRRPSRARRSSPRTNLEDADDSFDFDDEFGGAPAGRDEYAAPPSFDEDAVDTDADDSGLEDEIDGDKPSSGRAAGHRNIPSWEDAIGSIVDHNLQSRTQRKPSTHPSGRGGPSRGRPRGRRRKTQ